MDDIGIIEELGLQEVSRKTHIETKYLNYMVNKEFDKLNRINTLGFVKILRREYHLDLKEWVKEFEEYCASHQKPDLNKDVLYQKEIEHKESKAWILYLLVFLIAIGVAFWYFNGMQYITQIKEKIFNENNTSTFTQAPILNETKEKLEKLEKKIINEENAGIVEKATVQENNESSLVLNEDINATETNASTSTVIQNVPLEEIPLQESEILDNNLTQKEIDVQAQNTEQIVYEKVTIMPKSKLWIGTINLKTKKRKTRLTEKPIPLDIKEPHLLIVGHGNFIFEFDDNSTQQPEAKLKSYYHINNGTIKLITKDEFIELNGGKPW